MIVMIFSNFLAIGLAYLTFSSYTNMAYLQAWIATISIVSFIHAGVWLYYHFHPFTEDNSQSRIIIFSILIIFSAICWGSAGAMFFNQNLSYESILIMLIYAALVSGMLITISSIAGLFILYAYIIIFPLAVFLIAHSEPVLTALGLSLFLFFFVNILLSINSQKAVLDMFILKDENEALIANLSKQKSQAEQANSEKSKFLAAISHDLRQPMHAMGLFLSGLRPYVNKEGSTILTKVQDSAAVLSGLFNDLLDLSRLDADVIKPNIENLELTHFLQNIEQEFHRLAVDQGLKFESNINTLSVRSDPVLLDGVIRNLLSNAFQHSGSDTVRLECALNETKRSVTISIVDQGCGIPKPEIERIFSAYHQLHNGERDRRKGVGLGLAIVRRVCKLLYVPLNVESILGQGSTFAIELPIADEIIEIPDNDSVAPWDLQGSFIVLIEDEKEIREGTQKLFLSWGCQTIAARSGMDAIAQLKHYAQTPTALVVDYRLKGETGVDVIEQIRASFDLYIPAMIVTGDTSIDLLDSAKKYEFIVLYKPVSPAEYRTAIYQLIR